MKNIQVIKVNKGTALVKTRGLRRLVFRPGGKVFMELCDLDTAKDLMKDFAKQHREGAKHWVEMQKYPQ